MSDWDDFLYWENQRLDNGGVPLDEDPFNDPADFIEEEIDDEEEERTPQGSNDNKSNPIYLLLGYLLVGLFFLLILLWIL